MSDQLGPPLADARAPLSRLGAGVALILAAVVLFAGSRWLAGRQQHAYDPGAQPRAGYQVTGGRSYQLSSTTPVRELIDSGRLSTVGCTWSADGQVDNPLALTGTLNDERNRYQFAVFTAPVTAVIGVSCADLGRVFIDNADDTAPDWAGLLMLVVTLVGLTGAVLAVSGGYELTE